MVFQLPWHEFVPGELVVSPGLWIKGSKFKPSCMGEKAKKKKKQKKKKTKKKQLTE